MMRASRLSAALLVPLALAGLLLPACRGDRNQVATNGRRVRHAPMRAITSTTSRQAATTLTTKAQPPTTNAAVPAGITIANFAFVDVVAKAHSVTKVVNKDSAPHTLTADDLSFDTKTIDANATGEFTAPGPGTYKIHCVVHPFMTATLTVV